MTLLHPRVLAAALAVLVIHGLAIALASPTLAPAISAGLTIDLTLTAAVAVYFLAVRPRLVPPAVLAPVVLGGAAMAHWLLPATPVTTAVGVAVGGLEAVLAVAVARRVWRIGRRVRGRGAAPLLEVLESAVLDLGVPRRAAAFLATEVAIVAYAVTGWRRPRRDPDLFTVHRDKGWSTYAGVLIALTVVETVGLHVVLVPHLPVGAWILTALSVYSMLWLLGDALALRHHGVRISDEGLRIDVGLRWRADIPWSAIERIERVETRPAKAPDVVDACIVEATVALTLTTPVVVRGLIGRQRRATTIVLTVDDTPRFIEAIARRRGDAVAAGTGLI